MPQKEFSIELISWKIEASYEEIIEKEKFTRVEAETVTAERVAAQGPIMKFSKPSLIRRCLHPEQDARELSWSPQLSLVPKPLAESIDRALQDRAVLDQVGSDEKVLPLRGSSRVNHV